MAQTLVSSSTIKTLDISDCMLLPKGLDSILDSFREGTAAANLKLKGNNMNGSSIAQLGQVLAYNNTLKQLHIEWNNLGLHINSFAVFCDGLTRNYNIEQLNLRYAKLEENYQKIEKEKNILEKNLGDSQRIVSSLQSQLESFQNELIEPQKRYNLLKDELDQRKQISEKLKQELFEERARLKDQNLQIEKMNQQITTLNIRLNEVQISNTKLLCDRDKERKQLQDIISSKEHNLSKLRVEEVQRAGQLYEAFIKYLGSIGPNPIL